tara:strand:- start:8942 stop:9529 length:588 start_codon:yes stop_codon:yes gene_type:complete
MEKSYSLLASNHLKLIDDLENNKEKFESVHFDLIDNTFCEVLGLSIVTLEQLASETDYKIDLHLLVENPNKILKRINKLNIRSYIFHSETITSEEFNKIDNTLSKKGIGLLPDTEMSKLNEYIQSADFILFLCIVPSLFPSDDSIDPIKRVKEFKKLYPNFTGGLMVDGGITQDHISHLEELGVTNVVLGKNFFS